MGVSLIGLGDICVNPAGIVGIVTDNERQRVRNPDGTAEDAFVGVSGLGLPWTSPETTVIGTVQEYSQSGLSFAAWCHVQGYDGRVSESQGLKILEVGRALRLL